MQITKKQMEVAPWEPQSEAFKDAIAGEFSHPLVMVSRYGRIEVPLDIYFRGQESLPELEEYALSLCRGSVLDVGAGTGCHAAILQEAGLPVTAIDCHEGATLAMKQSGIRDIRQLDVFEFHEKQFDTLLLMMNGIGFVGNLQGLERWLRHARTLLHPGGQMIFDTADIRSTSKSTNPESGDQDYFGEVTYHLEYRNLRGQPFSWLYLDADTLAHYAVKAGWRYQIVYEDEAGHYLVVMHPL